MANVGAISQRPARQLQSSFLCCENRAKPFSIFPYSVAQFPAWPAEGAVWFSVLRSTLTQSAAYKLVPARFLVSGQAHLGYGLPSGSLRGSHAAGQATLPCGSLTGEDCVQTRQNLLPHGCKLGVPVSDCWLHAAFCHTPPTRLPGPRGHLQFLIHRQFTA